LLVGVRRATWSIMASMSSVGMIGKDMVLTFPEFCLWAIRRRFKRLRRTIYITFSHDGVVQHDNHYSMASSCESVIISRILTGEVGDCRRLGHFVGMEELKARGATSRVQLKFSIHATIPISLS
jgi:hypothetical protein